MKERYQMHSRSKVTFLVVFYFRILLKDHSIIHYSMLKLLCNLYEIFGLFVNGTLERLTQTDKKHEQNADNKSMNGNFHK